MKLWGSLSWRILVSAVVLGLLGTLASTYLSVWVGAEAGIRASSRPLTEVILRDHGEACRSSPEGWAFRTSDGVEVDAFDIARVTGPAGAGASGRRPSPELLTRLLQGEEQPFAFYFPLFNRKEPWGGAMLIRVADAGPCSVLEYRWPVSSERISHGRWLFLVAVLITAAVAALSTFVVIHPLLQRLRGLHRAAGGLGSDGFTSARDVEPDELGELSRVLDATHERVLADAARIEAQKHALERHLADVAHDLKTPIASLQLSLELASGVSTEQRPELLVQGLEDTVYLRELVENLRMACQLGEGVDPLAGEARVELGQTLERVVRRLGLLARRRDISLEAARPDEPVWVRCNPTMMEQAIGNLVHNAITHGDKEGHVVAVLETVESGRFRLTVLDDGPGLTPAELAHLGERAFRSPEARRRDPRGSGLGVSIVRELCRRIGFSLAFETNEPHGLKVVIEGALHTSSTP
ncbi:HAMP domain-containing sensor histidine kinase [Vitiosangium sp. GDMCC 1.1324]|uniref:sensor histidine kinase n=1 Tax=Vitiosangium sp. (strain GDMCC 1.1324) TaxID=2138576 RepID=UPI000D3C0653|nr:HAMP domain-containing sensor histidine kinase [Vitiosangium sp. GDMCC 1.1324]PTL84251.1 sensor histidine kinase [Vitiosangium sp. GDMCC 1.1324]